MATSTTLTDQDSATNGLIDLDETFLPTGRMRLLSRVTHRFGPRVTGEMDLTAADWVFPHHFPGDPVLPGTLTVEAAGQLVAAWAWMDGQRGRPRLVRSSAHFRHAVKPDRDRLVLQASVKRRRNMNFAEASVSADEQEVAEVELVLAILNGD